MLIMGNTNFQSFYFKDNLGYKMAINALTKRDEDWFTADKEGLCLHYSNKRGIAPLLEVVEPLNVDFIYSESDDYSERDYTYLFVDGEGTYLSDDEYESRLPEIRKMGFKL